MGSERETADSDRRQVLTIRYLSILGRAGSRGPTRFAAVVASASSSFVILMFGTTFFKKLVRHRLHLM